MVPSEAVVATTSSAADSILVAAKENVPPTAGMAAKTFAADSNFLCGNREWFRLQTVVAKPELHRFLISGPNLRIDASFSPFKPSCVHRFLISGSDLRIDARISPFKPSCVHRFLISGPNLGIDASFSPFKPSIVHRFLISGPESGIAAKNRWHCSNDVCVRF